MTKFHQVTSNFAHLSMTLADQAHSDGEDETAVMYIELARAIFDMNDVMAGRGKVFPRGRIRQAVLAARVTAQRQRM